jgi:hypothetical protein
VPTIMGVMSGKRERAEFGLDIRGQLRKWGCGRTWYYSDQAGGPWQSLGTSDTAQVLVSTSTPGEFWMRADVVSGQQSGATSMRVVNMTGNPCAPMVCQMAPSGPSKPQSFSRHPR